MSQSEFQLIRQYFADQVAPVADLPVGIGDDGAVIATGGPQLVWVLDTINEGVHFPVDAPGHAVGHRALAVNLSDMVAMGAEARWMLLSLSIPTADAAWVKDFSQGLLKLAREVGVTLAGGDTTRGPLSVGVTLLGPLHGAAICRGGARAGDRLLVSGTLGDARAGLDIALGDGTPADAAETFLLNRYLYPQPRLGLAPLLADYAHTAIDLSDGLCADLGHILAQSEMGAVIDSRRLPVSESLTAHAGDEAGDLALQGGDDYEILCSVPAASVAEFTSAAAAAGVRLSDIGEVTAEAGLRVVGADGAIRAPAAGFSHFGDPNA